MTLGVGPAASVERTSRSLMCSGSSARMRFSSASSSDSERSTSPRSAGPLATRRNGAAVVGAVGAVAHPAASMAKPSIAIERHLAALPALRVLGTARNLFNAFNWR